MINIQPKTHGPTLDSPIEHLNACHRRIEERLDTLERAGRHLQTRSDEALTAIRSAFRFFDSNGVKHTADEEESFFPRMSAHLAPGERQFLENLHTEHEQTEGLYAELTGHVAKMANPPTASDVQRYTELAAALCSLYRQHIRNEDARFPAIAQRILTTDDLTAIGQEMKHRRGI
ncbi:MAG: hemerythrin domain-containing protein [Acidobacteria bacterium]|nr:hemerythrin domain-containing protein [Acidobacteriota bacterium]